MSDEQDKLKLSLEPPKLFGRKKKSDAMGTKKRTSPAPEEPAAAEPEPAPGPAPEAVPEPVPEPAAEPEPVAQAAPDPEPEPEPVAVPEPEPDPAHQPVPQKAAAARPRARLAPEIEPEPLSRIEEEDAEIAARAAEPPLLPLYPAAALTGAVVGGAMVLLIWLSLRGCEAVRGTSSCTGGPGFLLLVATFVLCVLLGSTLLKVFSITDPGSSSFLAVGLVAVMALLFLIDVLDHWSMLIVIPILGVAGFLTSVWVTKTFVEESVDT